MPLETLERMPPPFFRQGPSALSRLVFFTALALFLMVADARFHLAQPLRAGISAGLSAVQWLTTQSLQGIKNASGYFVSLDAAQREVADARAKLIEQAQRAGQVEALGAENQRLRTLLGLRERVAPAKATAAQVLYDATDPFSRRVVIDKGQLQGIQPGSPVIDDAGVLGQVTRVYPFVSEITLLVDRDQAIPVLSPRTGLRSIAYGDPVTHGGVLELRYVSATEDVQPGDLLTTSGIDGVYPPGLPVARVLSVERQAESSFARILCRPLAHLSGVTWVMALAPVAMPPAEDTTGAQLPPLARAPDAASAASDAAADAASAAAGARP
jgi:rod shape-determining protein MreC